jgi:hypothetical protein
LSFTLLWLVAVMTANGPVTAKIAETTKFKSEAECIEFGRGMLPRVQDYGRGLMKLDWTDKVAAGFTCEADGQGA